uniref:HEAT repeat-containing protein 6 n=1 Tax=Sphaeramia orbicularis TaxID=375764 RepID=A0A673A4L6_9TELE
MAAQAEFSPAAPAFVSRSDGSPFPPKALSADAAPFSPLGPDGWQPGPPSDAERQFIRCSAKLRALRPDSSQLRDELNLLFDQLLSENYNRTFNPNISIRPEDVCSLLKHASSLVPLNQEHLVVKLCQLVHHLLNQLKVIMDELTLDVLVNYTIRGLKVCSAWTHSDVLLALSTIVYGNGPQCHQHLSDLLGEDGVLLVYSSPSQPDMELRRVALTCMANICLRIPGQPPLDDQYKSVCFRVFLKTLQSLRPPDTDELFYCMLIQAALKGLQSCLSGGKWKFGGGEELGSAFATLKRLMFQGTPGVSVEWPAVLYPAPLPQYEGLSSLKPPEPPKTTEPPKNAAAQGKSSGVRQACCFRPDSNKDHFKFSVAQKAATGGRGKEGSGGEGGSLSKPFAPSLYPSWKQSSSDSEFSDPEGGAQSKLRLYHGRVRQGALYCLLAVVKGVEKRTLYGYWSSFIPESPIGGPPPLTLLTIILKDPSPKVRACALQVLSAMLDGSRQFLGVAEDTASPRTSYTPFSFSLATAIRELHRALSLALLAETSPQTLTQIIKCLAYLVANAPYHRLKPGLLSPLWRQLRHYVRHRDVNVRVSVLTLYGALVTTQAPLPEVQLLLRQPENSSTGAGSFTPQDSTLSWRQRDGVSSPSRTPVTHSPHNPHTPREEDSSPPWLLQLCVSLVTQPREDQSDSEGAGSGGAAALEHSPVRLEALQVLSHLVRGYFTLCQPCLYEIGQVSARCLSETDPSIQLHGTKLLEELGTGIIQQYRAENNIPESVRVPMSLVVQFWSDVLSGPLNAALQNEQHPTLQTSACDTLSSILPQAFAQLPEKTQLMCITVLLGLTYSENYLVKTAAVRALGVYILFPCLREDVMFVADTANTILAALDDWSANVRAKAAWSLGNLTDTLTVNIVGVDFQEELSDMLLLKMLQAATKASADKDRVKCHAVRALGNLLHFLRQSQMTRSVFQRPLEDAVRALVKTVKSEATMKVRWNACYALGNAFRNPALPLDSAPWSEDAFSALCHVVTSCKNFKVRIKSATALAVPAQRSCYGDTERFNCVWRSLATALENSEDTNDFLEYRYSASLRHTLSQALLHLLSVCQAQDMPAIGASLAGEEGKGIRVHLVKYLRAEEGGVGGAEEEKDVGADSSNPQQRLRVQQFGLSGFTQIRIMTEPRFLFFNILRHFTFFFVCFLLTLQYHS